jgi:hypothetical protein
MDHPDVNMILRYVSNSVSSREQVDIDTHLGQCPECLRRVRAFSYLDEKFDSLWDSWTAVEHGCAYRRWRLAKALREAVEVAPALSEHARRWVERMKEGLEFSVRVLVDKSRTIASLGACVLPRQCEFRLCLSGTGIGSPDEQAKLEDHLHRGSQLLSEDRPDEATDELLQALRIDARSSQAAISQILWRGQLLCQTIVDSRRGRILVRLWPQEGQCMPTFALLIPEDEKGKVLTAGFQGVENELYVLAEFDRIDHTSYSLQIEPIVP